MDTINLILERLDIRKLNKECNIKSCNKIPSKKAIIIEIDAKKTRKRDLAVLYFCNEHYNVCFEKFLNELNDSCEAGKTIDKKVFEIGYITY